MKTLLIAAITALMITAAQAETFRYELPTVCDTTVNILRELTQEYQETLVWTGSHATDNSRLVLFVNERADTWTLVKMTEKWSCIVGAGSKSRLAGKDTT